MRISRMEYVDRGLPPDQYADTWNRLYLFTICGVRPRRSMWSALYAVKAMDAKVMICGRVEPVAYLFTAVVVN